MMSDYRTRRLRWFLSLGLVLFLVGEALLCVVLWRTSAWMTEVLGMPEESLRSDDAWPDRFWASVEIDRKLQDWGLVSLAVGSCAIVGSVAALAWLAKGRFSMRALLLGVTFVCLAIGFPVGVVGPRLHNPRFVYRAGVVGLEQHTKRDSHAGVRLLDWKIATTAALPICVVLPILLMWPHRVRDGR